MNAFSSPFVRAFGAIPLGAALMLGLAAGAAQAGRVPIGTPTNAYCGLTDISAPGVSVTACSGYFSGNMLQGGAGKDASPAIVTALRGLGLGTEVDGVTYLEKLGFSSKRDRYGSGSGDRTIDFDNPLNGVAFLGIHYGNTFGLGRKGYTGYGGGTAFYRIESEGDIDLLDIRSDLSKVISGAALFYVCSGENGCDGDDGKVPIPGSLGLLLAGLLGLGVMRARHTRERDPATVIGATKPLRLFGKASAAVVLGMGLGAGAQAAMVSAFTSQSAFADATGNTSPIGTENFSGFNGLGTVSSGGYSNGYRATVGGVTWEGRASGGLFAQDGRMSTYDVATPMILTFTGTAINAISGAFLSTDVGFGFLTDTLNVTVKLSDNSTQSFSQESSGETLQFWGFRSEGASITQLMFSPTRGDGYATLDELSFINAQGSGGGGSGEVPEPSGIAMLMLGLGMLACRRKASNARSAQI